MIRKSLSVLVLVCAAVFIYVDTASAMKTAYGGSFRLRQEYWENVTDLQTAAANHSDRDFFRLRTSVWAKMDMNENLGAYLKLTNEARYYLGNFRPFASSTIIDQRDERFDIDELLIDNLYLDAKKVFGLPVDLRIGRQDFLGVFGEGFLILEGTPGDGSRDFYFNAVKANMKLSNNTSLDLVYLYQPQKDEFLPCIHPNRSQSGYVADKKMLSASNETGVVVYGRSKLNSNISVEPYYMYKVEDPVGANTTLKLNTVGARFVATVDNWKVRAEYAHQFGEYDNSNRDRKGNGGYIFAGQKFDKASMKPEWEVGYVYLSGDDPKTADHEGWDPLFSRAPMWNELYIYTMIPETAKDGGPIPGYWTNIHIFKAGVKFALSPATTLAVSYQHLRSDEVTSGLSATMYTNNSKDRGDLGTLMLNHTFSKQVDGFLQVEYFAPGSFYTSKADDAVFVRWQLQFKF